MASSSTLVALLVAVSCAAAASATTYTVGDSKGWTTNVDYTTWASGNTFNAGDRLVFPYSNGQHDVVEVSKSGYDACSTSNALKTDTNGPTTITLTPGTHYYICGFTGHCAGGMKLAVTVGSGSPAAPGTPSGATPGTPRPSGASASTQAGPALAVAAGVLVKLALF